LKQLNDCHALLCNELTQSGSLFCGYHGRECDMYVSPEVDERFREMIKEWKSISIEFADWQLFHFMIYFKEKWCKSV